MDSQNSEDAKIRRREEMLAKRVGEALDQLNPRSAGECPDAEVIAAYHERALSPEESAQWESHFAACARCRKILLVLAASSGAPLAEREVVRLGEQVAAEEKRLGLKPGVEPADRLNRRLRWLAPVLAKVLPTLAKEAGKPLPDAEAAQIKEGLSATREEASPSIAPAGHGWLGRWLVPALGAALVVAIWFAVRPPWRATERSAPPNLIAQAPHNQPQPVLLPPASERESSPAVPAAKPEAKSAQLDRGKYPSAPSQNSSGVPNAANQLQLNNGPLRPSATTAPISEETKKEKAAGPTDALSAMQSASAEKAPAAVPPAAPGPQTRAQDKGAPPSNQGIPYSTAQSVTVPEASAAGTASRRDQQAAPSQEQTSATVDRAMRQESAEAVPSKAQNFRALAVVAPTLVLKAPSGSILWRAGKNGAIERSIDGGRSWNPPANPLRGEWLAGAAVSDTVCWLVGRNGAIARTLDGEHWDRISPPQAAGIAGKLPDWSGITARDARSTTITAADGRRFATPDGGETWQTLPPAPTGQVP